MIASASRTSVALILSVLVAGALSSQEKDWEPVDVGLETLAILRLDEDLSAAARNKDLVKFVSLLASNCWFIGTPSASGQRSFINAWSDVLFAEDSDSHFLREPRDATVALSGDLAVSFGSYEFSVPEQENLVGEYMTVWRRDEGKWRAAVNAPMVNWDPSLATLEIRPTRSTEHVWLTGDPGRVFADEPANLRAAASGDLAYALGQYQISLSIDDGSPVGADGYFLSIWEREPDQNWELSWESFPPPRIKKRPPPGSVG